MDDQMDEGEFRRQLLAMLDAGDSLERAMSIFNLAGPEWGLPLVKAVSDATEKRVLGEMLEHLEKHFRGNPPRDPEVHHSIGVYVNPRTGKAFFRIQPNRA